MRTNAAAPESAKAPSVSVIILTKNESANIADCIASAKLIADQIVVADGESTDRTVEIAEEAGAEVALLPSWDGWGIKRRQAQERCRGDYVLHLDADERITPELAAELKAALAAAQGHEIFALPRCNHLFGAQIRHCGWYPDYVKRCYKRTFTQYNEARVHEHVEEPQGSRIVYLKHPLLHYTYQSMQQCLEKQKNYALNFAEEKGARGKRVSLISIPLRALFTFIRVYFLRLGFLDGRFGWWNAWSSAGYTLNKYLALYVEQSGRRIR